MKKSNTITRVTILCLLLSLISILGFNRTYVNAQYSDFTDIEVKFVIYPEGTVGLSAKYNYTTTSPNLGATGYVNAQVAKDGNMHDISVDATLNVPPEEASEFPFNATEVSMLNEYSDEILSSSINASIVLPDRAYIDSTMFDFSGFPFNSTDITIDAEYSNQAYDGIITVHMVPGLALGDVELYFEGNITEVTIDDSVTVYYDLPLSIPDFTPLDETSLNGMLQMLNSTIPGEGPDSLYNMTDGTLTCTTFDTTLTPIENGAVVSFYVTIHGDFIEAVSTIFAEEMSTEMDSMMPIYPLPNATAIYSLLNATIQSVKSGELTMSYSQTARRLDLQATFTQNLEEFSDAITQIMPSMYPPELQPYLESMLNITYCSADSYTERITYSDGQVNYEANYTLEGDPNAQLNHMKNIYVDIMNATSPQPEWLINTIKATDVDASNLKLSFNMSTYSVLCNFEGIEVAPPIEQVNATSFRLEKFFNITSGPYEPPRQNERMKLIVQGGSNETHTVTPIIDPTDPNRVPDPDEYACGNTMIWNNQNISKLRRLIFKVWEGCVDKIYDPTSITQNNPYVIDAKEHAGCTLSLTDISEVATIFVKNITAPTDVDSLPGAYQMLGNYIQVTADPEDVAVNVTIRIYYTLEQLSASGLDENSLTIFYWDSAANSWTAAETHINTAEHYAWTVVNHLSIWSLAAQAIPFWQQPWFLALIVAIVAVAIIVVILLFRRKRQPTQTKET
jgi:hypothetical protein